MKPFDMCQCIITHGHACALLKRWDWNSKYTEKKFLYAENCFVEVHNSWIFGLSASVCISFIFYVPNPLLFKIIPRTIITWLFPPPICRASYPRHTRAGTSLLCNLLLHWVAGVTSKKMIAICEEEVRRLSKSIKTANMATPMEIDMLELDFSTLIGIKVFRVLTNQINDINLCYILSPMTCARINAGLYILIQSFA